MDISQLLSQMSPEELQQFSQLASVGVTRDQGHAERMARMQHKYTTGWGAGLGAAGDALGQYADYRNQQKQDSGRLAYMQALQRLISQQQQQPDFFEGGGKGLKEGAAFD